VANFNPGRERQQLAEVYADMADGELKKLAADAGTLTDMAKEVLKSELSKRKLDIALQDTTATAKEEALSQLVTLRTYRDVPEALLAKSVLDSAGVECFLGDENTIRMDWLWSNLLGGVKLWIRREDVDAATALLGQTRPDTFDAEAAGENEQPRCPNCQSFDVSFQGLKKPLAYGSLLVGVPIPAKHDGWRCNSCGHEWDDSNEPSKQPP
jgi:Putative prokaryotic signal transducing protein